MFESSVGKDAFRLVYKRKTLALWCCLCVCAHLSLSVAFLEAEMMLIEHRLERTFKKTKEK